MPERAGILGWLTAPANVAQWERLAVWIALAVCMGWLQPSADVLAALIAALRR